jgi:hypothetical protein
MDHAQRQKTASELNAAILASQCQVQHPARLSWRAEEQMMSRRDLSAAYSLLALSSCLDRISIGLSVCPSVWPFVYVCLPACTHLSMPLCSSFVCPCKCISARGRAKPDSAVPMALQEKEPRLPGLLKRLIWAQNQLDDKKVVYPRIAPNDLVTATLSEPVLE